MSVWKAGSLVVGLMALLAVAPASADTMALTFAGGEVPTPVSGRSIDVSATGGWTFTLGSTITVTALGLWDEDADGIAFPHTITMWDSSGSSLFSANVSGTGSFTEPGDADGQWVFSSNLAYLASQNAPSPLILTQGTYTISAYFEADPGDTDAVRRLATATTAPGITFGSPVENLGAVWPTTTYDNYADAYFGPNFMFKSGAAVTVAEPRSWAFLVLGFVGLAFVTRRRSRWLGA